MSHELLLAKTDWYLRGVLVKLGWYLYIEMEESRQFLTLISFRQQITLFLDSYESNSACNNVSAFVLMSMGAYGTLWKATVKLTYAYDLGLYGTDRIVVIAEAWPQNVAPLRTSDRWYDYIFILTVAVNVNYKIIVSHKKSRRLF